MSHTRTTLVVHSYVVQLDNKAELESQVAFMVSDEVLIEAEDDIVTAAVFLYNVEASFGDEWTCYIDVLHHGGEDGLVALERDGYNESDLKLGDVYHGYCKVTITGATHRQ